MPLITQRVIDSGEKIWIDVDVGAGLGLNPMLLRLDDLKEFYFDDNMEIVE